jgi:site-specific recombinase XerD
MFRSVQLQRCKGVLDICVVGLASLAGHKSIATTQAYIDVNDAMKRAAVELVRRHNRLR